MSWIISVLSAKGELSTLRIMCFLSLFAAIYIGIAGLYLNKNLSDLAMLCGMFLGAAFTGKVTQKVYENKQ